MDFWTRVRLPSDPLDETLGEPVGSTPTGLSPLDKNTSMMYFCFSHRLDITNLNRIRKVTSCF